MCLLLVGTCFTLKLSFIDMEDPESEEQASQAQTNNVTQAQPEQQKVQEQPKVEKKEEDKDSFADLLK